MYSKCAAVTSVEDSDTGSPSPARGRAFRAARQDVRPTGADAARPGAVVEVLAVDRLEDFAAQDGFDRAARRDESAVEEDDSRRVLTGEVEVVRDEERGAGDASGARSGVAGRGFAQPAQRSDELEDADLVLGIEAGSRLVDQENRR